MSLHLIEGLENRRCLSAAPHAPGICPATGTQSGDVVQLRQHDRLKDGSCQTTVSTASASASATATADKLHTRARDGSCLT